MEGKIQFAIDRTTGFVVSRFKDKMCVPILSNPGKPMSLKKVDSDFTKPNSEVFIWDIEVSESIKKEHINFWLNN
jgi:hypothetical protein